MLRALAADAIFCAAVFLETLAALSILQGANAIQLREEFDPILAFYHAHLAPVIAFGASLVPAHTPTWFADATIIATVLFFLFFIKQARRATAAHDADFLPHVASDVPTRAELAIDWLLPASFCAIGAFLCSLTLLPFLTLPIAVWLAVRKAWNPSWFEISGTYYMNILILAGAIAAILAMPR
jgi:hypothetical protein